jgi:hypothetical protein
MIPALLTREWALASEGAAGRPVARSPNVIVVRDRQVPAAGGVVAHPRGRDGGGTFRSQKFLIHITATFGKAMTVAEATRPAGLRDMALRRPRQEHFGRLDGRNRDREGQEEPER